MIDDHEDLSVFDSSDAAQAAASLEFASSYHVPVMCQECVSALLSGSSKQPEPAEHGRVFVDATLGGGGHAQALLESLTAGDVVFGCDVDPDALRAARARLSSYLHDSDDSSNKPLFIPVQSNFADLHPRPSLRPAAASLRQGGGGGWTLREASRTSNEYEGR